MLHRWRRVPQVPRRPASNSFRNFSRRPARWLPLRLETLERRWVPASFAVNAVLDDIDANPGDGICETQPSNNICTLRAAIIETNALPGPDLVVLGSGIFPLTIPGTGEEAGFTGDLDITDELTVQGAGMADTVIQAGATGEANDRVFHVHNGITAVLEDLTITGGAADRRAGGGGLLNRGFTTLRAIRLLSNSAGGEGGGAFNEGTLVAMESQFHANAAGTSGGGIYNTSSGTVELKDSNLATNTASTVGGGIANAGGVVTLRRPPSAAATWRRKEQASTMGLEH